MNEDKNWILPQKVAGEITPHASFRIPSTTQKALGILAQRESQRLGVQVSQATLLINFATRDDNFARVKRTELRKIIDQLRKGNHHVSNPTTDKEPQANP